MDTSLVFLVLLLLDTNVIVTSLDSPLPFSCGHSSKYAVTLKITGGRDAAKGEFPYMVAIFGVSGKLSCGGSLISNDTVLTAAHCLSAYSEKQLSKLRISIGDHNIRSASDGVNETRKIRRVFLHKEFNTKTYQNDIALILLDSPVQFNDYIQPICLALTTGVYSRQAFEGGNSHAIATGWGQLTSGIFGISSDVLRKVEMPLWKLSECQKIYSRFAPGRISNSTICAGDGRRNKDACIGDSGGPLVIRNGSVSTQIGIISWGKGCGSFPGVYTNVKYYSDWILSKLSTKNKPPSKE